MSAPDLLSILRRVTTLSFSARSALPDGWNGDGSGSVRVDSPEPTVVTFQESGRWAPHGGPSLQFSNVYKWTRQSHGASAATHRIRLEHLRQGPERPVYLLDMIAKSGNTWHCAAVHECGQDRYALNMQLDEDGRSLRMQWSIQGPRKSEEIEYVYGLEQEATNR